MCAPHGGLWVAFLDDNDVKYFTNDINWKTRIPKSIEAWRDRFKDKEVKFISDVQALPDNTL